ncbi:MAG: hypothetical protein DI570_25660 [Phenylobacterium zucineum]|nr:MAG: hypothetical protein DI570_25660 [Phenylobacterium zucineum]
MMATATFRRPTRRPRARPGRRPRPPLRRLRRRPGRPPHPRPPHLPLLLPSWPTPAPTRPGCWPIRSSAWAWSRLAC